MRTFVKSPDSNIFVYGRQLSRVTRIWLSRRTDYGTLQINCAIDSMVSRTVARQYLFAGAETRDYCILSRKIVPRKFLS